MTMSRNIISKTLLLRYYCHCGLVNGKWIFTSNYKTASIQHFKPITNFHTSCITCKKLTKEEKLAKVQDFNFVSPKKRKRVIDIWPNMTVQELSIEMGKPMEDVLELMTFVDNTISYTKPSDNIDDWKTLCDIVAKANLRFKFTNRSKEKVFSEDNDIGRYPPAPEHTLEKRPPVVTIMGHVDHGKTTLLDYLRKSSIVSEEFGGITQHIGAFSVAVKSKSITFLDTPGHAAFSAMRSRGAHCTDIVVLVVAADDGVMEQTVESIRMAKEAKVPIVVAINKIDRPNTDIERTKKMLVIQGLALEEFGGDIQVVPISALKGMNIDDLTEAILAQAELADLKADYKGYVEGIVIESKLDRHRGKICTALIQRGILKKSYFLIAGCAWAKVKSMYDDKNKKINEASPSTPVEIVGWNDLPSPGDLLLQVETEKKANEIVNYRKKKALNEKALQNLPTLENIRAQERSIYRERMLEKRKYRYVGVKWQEPVKEKAEENDSNSITLELNVVIKCDVEGSLEALTDILFTYHNNLCKLNIVHTGIGNVSLKDVEIADAFNAIVYSFNVDVLSDAQRLADSKQISIRYQNVIYRFMDDVKKEINSRLPHKKMEEVLGEATVLELFLITENKKKNVPVAGCKCIKGDLKKNSLYKIIRGGQEIHRGTLSSMRNMKTEVTSIKKDQHCGLKFEDKSVIFQVGDTIQAYRTYEVPQEIDWNPF